MPINFAPKSGASLATQGWGGERELKTTVNEVAKQWPLPSLQKKPRLESLVHTTWNIFENATALTRLSMDEAFIHYRESSRKIRTDMRKRKLNA